MISPKRVLVFFRRDLLLTISTLGLALSLIGGLGPLLVVARIAHYIVEHWVWLTSFAWTKIFAFFGVDIPPLLGFSITMLLFHFGLVATGLRKRSIAEPSEAASVDRDRLFALLLYLPILWGTLSTAFAALASHMADGGKQASAPLIVLAFCLVVASPVMAFWLARPRVLVRRFVTVYVVATAIVLLDALARILEMAGIGSIVENDT